MSLISRPRSHEALTGFVWGTDSSAPVIGAKEFGYSLSTLVRVMHFSMKCGSPPPREWLLARLIWPSWFHRKWSRSDRQEVRSTIWVLWYLEYKFGVRSHFVWDDLLNWKRVVCTVCKILGIRTRSSGKSHTVPEKREGLAQKRRSKLRLERFLKKKQESALLKGKGKKKSFQPEGKYIPPARRLSPPRHAAFNAAGIPRTATKSQALAQFESGNVRREWQRKGKDYEYLTRQSAIGELSRTELLTYGEARYLEFHRISKEWWDGMGNDPCWDES